MKKKIAVAAILMLALVGAMAVQAADTTTGPPAQRQAFANRLGLTADQVQQITEIRQQLMIDIKGVSGSSIPRPEKIAKVKELVATATDAVFNILTPEQRDKIAKAAIALRLLHLPRAGGGFGYWAFLRDIDLSDGQKAQLQEIMKAVAPQVKAIREDTSLTPQQKALKLKDLRKATLDKVLAILTPAQREKANAAIEKMETGGFRGQGQGFRRQGAGARAGVGAGRKERVARPGNRPTGTSAARGNGAANAEIDIDALLN